MKSIVGNLIGDRYFILRELKRERFVALYLAQIRNDSESSQSSVRKSLGAGRTSSGGFLQRQPLDCFEQAQCQIERLHFPPQNNLDRRQYWQNLAKIFQTEAIALKELGQHPQIPGLLDYFIEEREFYLVTQLCAGKSLDRQLQNKHLTEPEAIFWLQNVLETLEFIHQKEVLHLNIKPENLFQLQPNDGISLTNFGTVENSLKLFYRSKHSPLENIAYDDYVPLEQREGNSNYSSDLYALGKTIIYALTGEVPNLQNASSVNYQKPLLAEISDRAEVNISYKLNRILSKMIEENSLLRYQSAAEAIAELKQNENTVALPLPFADFSRKERSAAKKIASKPKSKVSKNWIWLLLCLPFITALIIFLIGINRNVYKNFSDYTNDNYYLTIKYPQSWTLRESEDPITGEIVVFTSPLDGLSDFYRESVYVSIEYLTIAMTLDEYLETTIDRIESEGNQIEGTPQETTLDEERAITIVYYRQVDGVKLKQKETFTIIDNRVYIVIYVAEETRYNKYLKTVRKILKSLDIEPRFYSLE